MYTYDMLIQWSLKDLQETVAELGITNAHEWDADDCIDYLLNQ